MVVQENIKLFESKIEKTSNQCSNRSSINLSLPLHSCDLATCCSNVNTVTESSNPISYDVKWVGKDRRQKLFVHHSHTIRAPPTFLKSRTLKHQCPLKSIDTTSFLPTRNLNIEIYESLDNEGSFDKDPVLTIDELQFHHLLGEGQFGQVWLASSSIHQSSTRQSSMAVKVLSKFQLIEDGGRSGAVHYLKREIDILRELKEDKRPHPCIVELIEAMQDDNLVYIAQEYCSGGDLFTLLSQKKSYSLHITTKFYAACIIDALHFLHERGILYRDLKPENIVLRQDTGYPVLIDFGFAKHLQQNKMETLMSQKQRSIMSSNHQKFNKTNHNDYIKDIKSCVSVDITNVLLSEDKMTKYFTDDTTTTQSSTQSSTRYTCNSVLSEIDDVTDAFVGDEYDEYYGSSHRYSDSSNLSSIYKDHEFRCYSMVGTPKYVAPEVIQGLGYDYRADLWSFGVVLYEMLAGYNPMEGPNCCDELCDAELIRCIIEEDYVPLPNGIFSDSTINYTVTDLIDRLLVRDPQNRLISSALVLQHQWFSDIDFENIRRQVVQAPWIPSNCNEPRTTEAILDFSLQSSLHPKLNLKEQASFMSLDTR